MRFFGKLIGLILGVTSGTGLLGFLLGALVGHIADNFYEKIGVKKYQDIFSRITFQVMGHLSKSKGYVTYQDIQIALLTMERMQLHGNARSDAKLAFQEGKEYQYPLRRKLQELKNICIGRFDLIRTFLEIQIQTALSDGVIHPREKEVLLIIAEELGISYNQFQYFINAIHNNNQFNHFEKNNSWKENNSQNCSKEKIKTSVEEACKTLGVNKNDDYLTIKRAYRKLMSIHHPDKLVTKNLTKSMLEAEKKKAQKIQLAYNFLKKEKNFK